MLPEQMMLSPSLSSAGPLGPDPWHVMAKTTQLGCSPGAPPAETGLLDFTGAQSLHTFFPSSSRHAVQSLLFVFYIYRDINVAHV